MRFLVIIIVCCLMSITIKNDSSLGSEILKLFLLLLSGNNLGMLIVEAIKRNKR